MRLASILLAVAASLATVEAFHFHPVPRTSAVASRRSAASAPLQVKSICIIACQQYNHSM
jgi:hypothetical protein